MRRRQRLTLAATSQGALQPAPLLSTSYTHKAPASLQTKKCSEECQKMQQTETASSAYTIQCNSSEQLAHFVMLVQRNIQAKFGVDNRRVIRCFTNFIRSQSALLQIPTSRLNAASASALSGLDRTKPHCFLTSSGQADKGCFQRRHLRLKSSSLRLVRAYTTAEQPHSNNKTAPDDVPQPLSAASAFHDTEGPSSSFSKAASKRFSHRRGAPALPHQQEQQQQNTNKNEDRRSRRKSPLRYHSTGSASASVRAPASPSPSSSKLTDSRTNEHRGSSAKHGHASYKNNTSPATDSSLRPSSLRSDKTQLPPGQCTMPQARHNTAGQVQEEEVMTQWSAQSSTGEKRPSAVHAPPTHVQSEAHQRRGKESKETPAKPTADPPKRSASTLTGRKTHASLDYPANAKQDCTALRRLLRDHTTYAKNFTTLQSDNWVVAASLERLGIEAVARSGLLEALASAFERTARDHAVSSEDDFTALGDLAAAAAARSSDTVRLVVTHLAMEDASSKAPDTVATVEISRQALAWLRSPIQLPTLPPADLMASVEKTVAVVAQLTAHAENVNTRGEASTRANQEELNGKAEEQLEAGLLLWYRQWSSQQLETPCETGLIKNDQHSDSEAASTDTASPALSAPDEIGMSRWYDVHCGVSQALVGRCCDVNRALVSEDHDAALGTNEVNNKNAAAPSLENWRTLPRTTTPLLYDKQQSSTQPNCARPPVRPDQTVSVEMKTLLRNFEALLNTLVKFKSTIAEQQLMRQEQTQVFPTRSRGATNQATDALSQVSGAPRTEDEQRPLLTGVENACAESGCAGDARATFAELQQAVMQLHRVAAQSHLLPAPPSSQDMNNPSSATAMHEKLSSAQKHVREVGQRWLFQLSRVDIVRELPQGAEITCDSRDTFSALDDANVFDALSSPPAKPVWGRGALPSGTYTIAALDLLISVFLRCLLFYVPALTSASHRTVMQCLLQPWMALDQRAQIGLWTTHLTITSLLTTRAAVVLGGAASARDASSTSAASVSQPPQTGSSPADQHPLAMPSGSPGRDEALGYLTLSNALLLKLSVKVLRVLCWPTVTDHRSKVVQQLFHSPASTARGAQSDRQASSANTRVSATSRQYSSQSENSPAAASSSWIDVVSTLQSSAALQRLGYELLLLLMTAVDKAHVFAVASEMEKSKSGLHSEADGIALDSDTRRGSRSRLTPKESKLQRDLAATCFVLVDLDRYINEQVYSRSKEAGLPVDGAVSLVPSLASKAVQPTASQQLCSPSFALQMTTTHGLARQTFGALHELLLEIWPHIVPRRQQMLWDAFRYAVVAPAAAAVFTSVRGRSADAALVEKSFLSMSHICAMPPWQAAAPVLHAFNAQMTPTAWKLLWSYVAAELASFPVQMKGMIQPAAQPPSAPATSHERPAANQTAVVERATDAAAAAVRVTEDGIAGALSACWTELTELALMCAWLVVAAEHAFPAASTSSEHAPSKPAVQAECERRVLSTFATCIKRVLAVWTEAGTAAEVGQQLLQLMCIHLETATTPDGGSVDEKSALVQVMLLERLSQAYAGCVWTAELKELVQDWAAQTRFLQQQQQQAQAAPPPAGDDDAGSGSDDRLPSGSKATSIRSSGTDLKVNVPLQPLEGLEGADPCILAWWRSLSAEDVGLPSVHVYLLQVFTELHRIVRARKESARREDDVLSPSLVASATKSDTTVESYTITSTEAAVQDSGSAAAVASNNDAECTQREGENKTRGAAAAPAARLPLPAVVFSAAELIVVLRLLSNISTRSGVSAVNSYVGAQVYNSSYKDGNRTINTNSSSSSSSNVGEYSSSVNEFANSKSAKPVNNRTGSILESLHRIAKHAANSMQSSQPEATGKPMVETTSAAVASSGKKYSGVGLDAAANSAAAAPTTKAALAGAEVDAAVDDLEQSLLRSIQAHALALPAASLLEAVWLGLFPMTTFCAVVTAKDTQTETTDSASGQRATKDERHATSSESVFHALSQQPTLQSVGSPWLAALHKEIGTSAHTRLLCCFLVYRHYSLFWEEGNIKAGHTTCGDKQHSAAFAPLLSNEMTSPTERFSSFLQLLLGSLVENLVSTLSTVQAATDAANKEAAVSDRLSNCNEARNPPQSADAACRASSAEDKHEPVTLLKEQARYFLQVFVLATEAHFRLRALETLSADGLTVSRTDAALAMRDVAVEHCRSGLGKLYGALLAAVEAYIPFAERGYSLDVVQMVSMITWKMQSQGVLSGTSAASAKRDVEGKENNTSINAPFLGENTDGQGGTKESELLVEGPVDSPNPLLFQYGKILKALMPHVDAEVVACTKSTVPSVLKFALVVSAKAAVEHTMQIQTLPGEAVSNSGAANKGVLSLTETASPESVASNTASSAAAAERAPVEASSASSIHPDATPTKPSALSLTPTFGRKPFWSQVPLEIMFHRAASERTLAMRHANTFCAMAVVAPELATSLLPLANVLFSQAASMRVAKIELTFKAIAACAVAFHQQCQRELYERERVSLLSTSMTAGAVHRAGGSRDDAARARADGVKRDNRFSAPVLPGAAGLRNGEMSVKGLSNSVSSPTASGDRTRNEEQQQLHTLPIYRSAGALASIRETPPQLRRVWATLSRCLLERESDADFQQPSLWLTAFYSGGAAGVAESQLFEQLLASFVFSPLMDSTQVEGSADTHDDFAEAAQGQRTRVSRLDAMGWSLLIGACATASHHDYREKYRELLREELVAFLRQLPVLLPAEREGASTTELSLTTVRTICELLETIPKLFIENDSFWDGVVKRAVLNCCLAASQLSQTGRGGAAAEVQWKQSFNWAVTSAGHGSLVFREVLEDKQEAGAAAAVEALERSLRNLNSTTLTSTTVKAFAEDEHRGSRERLKTRTLLDSLE